MTLRRSILALGAGALAAPLHVLAQPVTKVRRIGYLNSSNLATTGTWIKSFTDGLRAHGWIEGQNLVLDMRFADGDPKRITPLLQELLALKPDVLVTGTDLAAKSAQALTKTAKALGIKVPQVVLLQANRVIE